jgi:hypothetical protein
MRSARLIHRPVRVLGGPTVRAACGGNPSLLLVLRNVALAALVACRSFAALGGRALRAPDPALLGLAVSGFWMCLRH